MSRILSPWLKLEARVAEGAQNYFLNYHKYSLDTQKKRREITHERLFTHLDGRRDEDKRDRSWLSSLKRKVIALEHCVLMH